MPIHDDRTLIRCPHCVNEFHRDHLAAWLLKEKHCPVCREELSMSFRDDLRPKTERERRRLDQILNTLDNVGNLLGEYETSKGQRNRLRKMRAREMGLDDKVSIFDLIRKLIVPIVFLTIAFLALLAYVS